MFGKLLKHEFRATFRTLLPLILGLLGAALLARGSIWLMDTVDNPAVNVFGGFMITIFVLACIAALVLTVVYMIVRFVKSVLSDEGYLTHTLPVSVHSILLSRLLVSFVSLLVITVSVVVSILVVTFHIEDAQQILRVLKEIFLGQKEVGKVVILLAAMLFLGFLVEILHFYAAMSVGHSFANKKGGFSVLFYFVMYFAQQIVSTIALVVVLGAKFSNTMTVEADGAGTFMEIPTSMLTVSLCISVVFGIAYYLLSWLMLKKRLNLS